MGRRLLMRRVVSWRVVVRSLWRGIRVLLRMRKLNLGLGNEYELMMGLNRYWEVNSVKVYILGPAPPPVPTSTKVPSSSKKLTTSTKIAGLPIKSPTPV